MAYKVRFDSTAGRATRVTFVTEGVLLRMLGADPLLPQYQVVIIDEVGALACTCTSQRYGWLTILLRVCAESVPASLCTCTALCLVN